jgi:hypothetical protein
VSKSVIALREAVPGLNDAADVNSVVDILAPMQMLVIGGSDPTWKRDNPNWLPVLNAVRADLKNDLAPALDAQVSNNASRWNRALETHLSAAQIDELLHFYRSDTGRRYLAFQKRLIDIQVDGSSSFVAGLASGGMDLKQARESPPTAAQIETRKNIVQLSWLSRVTPAVGVGGSPSHGTNASGDKAINDMMIDVLVKTRGRALDVLDHEYHRDLVAFATFQDSPSARALISVYGAVAKEAAGESPDTELDFSTVLRHSVELHTPTWRAAYEAGRIAQQPVVK